MNAAYQAQLEKNIGKYSWFKIFTKRVYLPLIAIQLVNEGRVTVSEIALIAIVSGIVQFILQVPTGYFADKYGNKLAIVTGALIALPSPLLYVLKPDFFGGMAAAVLFFAGFSFLSGAIEAFIHDTLVELKREAQYSKVMGRAQSYGLLGNVVLIATVPATYAIDNRLPFILGFVAQIIVLGLALSFTYPPHQKAVKRPNPFVATKNIVTKTNIAMFLFAGFMTGVSYRGGDYRELLWADLGIAVSVFGFLLAGSSIVGAVMGLYVHQLDRLKPVHFYGFDLLFMTTTLLVVGLTANPVLAVIGFILFTAYDRVRMIVFQSKLLASVTHAYKATLISSLNLFTIVGQLAAITLLSRFIDQAGYQRGYFQFASAALVIGAILWLITFLTARKALPE